ncbi:hypothetical protein SEUCBS139899_000210 [Sporothrix eucalyptigena]|uniref:Small ribosomal subunit protein uS7 domain-containing protein n=1 Tax=Sporothrix eucalyptigena TaxID=1812306 RepID=A0ABP0BNE9_9PEZI
MSSSRIAPLWRSSGRCLALRPATTTAARPQAMASPAVTTLIPRWKAVGAFPAAVRGYADDATTRGGDDVSTSSTQSTEAAAPLPTQKPAEQTIESESELAAPEAKKKIVRTPRTPEDLKAMELLKLLAAGNAPYEPHYDGHKFGLNTGVTRASTAGLREGEEAASLAGGLAFPLVGKVQNRYDDLISQVTRLMMRDGKLAKAQREMAIVLNHLRTAPTPKLDPAHPLIPGHPPAAQLPLNPVLYLTLAIDSVAPMIRIMQMSGAAGGGRALPIPLPLARRQRRRAAFMWLLEVVSKKQSRGSGRNMFATRIAEEVVAIVEGRSSLWEKRLQLHKQGTAARINTAVLTEAKVKTRRWRR